ncbi:hypothetical protein KoxyNG13_031360 [Klebsiella pasteurii]
MRSENKIANQYVMVFKNTLADNNKSKKIDHAVSDRIPANRVRKWSLHVRTKNPIYSLSRDS